MKTPEGADLTVTRSIDAPAERVYDAWLDPNLARKFLFATEGGSIIRAEIDPKVGGRFTMTDRRNHSRLSGCGAALVNAERSAVDSLRYPGFRKKRSSARRTSIR